MQGEHEPGVLVFAPGVPLNFTNAARICSDMKSAVAGKQQPVKLLVIEASSMIDIDYTGSQMLQQAIVELRAKGIAIAVARLSGGQAQRQASHSGLLEAINADHVFLSVEDAVRKLGPNQADAHESHGQAG
jgi:MFS superfamily sulfate permease-like transporter